MFGLTNRHRLEAATRDELERLVASLGDVLSVEHHEDGTHRLGAWTDYQPRWTSHDGGAAIGNGSVVGRYMRLGRTVCVRIAWLAGSTTTYGTGNWRFSVPVPVRYAPDVAIGTALGVDLSPAAFYPGVAVFNSGDAGVELVDGGGVWTASAPITWAPGDFVRIAGRYEVADEVT